MHPPPPPQRLKDTSRILTGGTDFWAHSDVFPHEAAVAWTRQHPVPKGDLNDVEATLCKTLRDCAALINNTCDVEGLRSDFPKRFADLIRLKGDCLENH